MSLEALVEFVRAWRINNPTGTKQGLVSALSAQFSLEKNGALLVGQEFAVRVSQNASDTGFPNAVVAIRKIVAHDARPVVVCLLTPNRCELFLANTTFLRKVSHSSHDISEQKLVGSILGSDILVDCEGIDNTAENLSALWGVHEHADHAAHLARIIAATCGISVEESWLPSEPEVSNILSSPALASTMSGATEYAELAAKLDASVQEQRDAILVAAVDINAKTRGDRIEELVTGGVKNQGLGDLTVEVLTTMISIDIKSKRLDLSSAPKAYNVDKLLSNLALGNRLLAILFVGIDPSRGLLSTRLVSVFDRTLLAATRIDARWSRRGSRGTAQFSGGINDIWNDGFRETIDTDQATNFLRTLIGEAPRDQGG